MHEHSRGGDGGQTSKKSSVSNPAWVAAIAVSEQEASQRARSSCSRRGQRGQAVATSSASVPRCAWWSWPRNASSVVGYGPRPGPLIGGSTSTVPRRATPPRAATTAAMRAPIECPSRIGRSRASVPTTVSTSAA